jgi:hypothetical protein
MGLMIIDVSEDRVASTFRVEKIESEEKRSRLLASQLLRFSSLADFFYPEEGVNTFLRNAAFNSVFL